MAEDVRDAVSEIANSFLDGKSQIKLLEAGCGSATHVRFRPMVHAVGIDISKEQLARNTVIQEKILGDIQEYPLPKEEYDVAVCWMVLEHLPKPKAALSNLFDSIKPQGLLILGIPNLLSFKGVVTKFTPYWFHRFFYRFMKCKSSPFPTYLRVTILPRKIVRFAEDNGFSVVYFKLLEGSQSIKVKNRFWFMRLAFSVADSVMRVISLGRLPSLLLDNCFIVLRKA
jgi:2-polyprenyl-3-methyl-5-hydroxy-6-metoxy-1,4-benzoquinol methylase